jgi:hypothetical protein
MAIALPVLVILSPVFVLAAWYDHYRAGALRRAFQRRFGTKDKIGILVYSNGPHWQHYIEDNWLPRFGHRFVVLNWSERSTWQRDHALESKIFRRFAGAREFNPIAIILNDVGPHATWRAWIRAVQSRDIIGMLAPGVAEAHVIRFWQPFKDFKHGKDRGLRAAEAELVAALDRRTSAQSDV